MNTEFLGMFFVGLTTVAVLIEKAKRDIIRATTPWEPPRDYGHEIGRQLQESSLRLQQAQLEVVARLAETDEAQQAEIDEVRKALAEMKERSAYR